MTNFSEALIYNNTKQENQTENSFSETQPSIKHSQSIKKHFKDTLPNYSEVVSGGFNKIISSLLIQFFHQFSFDHIEPYKVDEMIRETTKLGSSIFKSDKQVGFTQYIYDFVNQLSSGYKFTCKATFFTLDFFKKNPIPKYSYKSLYLDASEYICEVPAKFLKNVGFAKQKYVQTNPNDAALSLSEFIYKQFSFIWVIKASLECFIVIPNKKVFDAAINDLVINPLIKPLTYNMCVSYFLEGSVKTGSFLWFSRVAEKAVDLSLKELNFKNISDSFFNHELNHNTSYFNITLSEASAIQEQIPSFNTQPLDTSISSSFHQNNKSLNLYNANIAYNSSNQDHYPYCLAEQSEHYKTFDTTTINMFLAITTLIAIDSSWGSKDFTNKAILDFGIITYTLNSKFYSPPELWVISEQCPYKEIFTWLD